MKLPLSTYAFFAAGAVSVVAFFFTGYSWISDIGLSVAATGALLWRAARTDHARWIWVGVAANLIVGWLAFGALAASDRPTEVPPLLSAPWLLYFAASGILIVTWGAAARLRGPRDPISTIDGLAVAAAAAVPFWVAWVGPAIRQTELGAEGVASALVTPALYLVLIAVGVRTLLGPGRWNVPALLMMLGLASMAVGDVGFNLLVLTGDADASGPTDIGWLLAYTFWGAAAVHPRADESLTVGDKRYGVAASRRVIVVVLAAALPLGAIAIAHIEAVEVKPAVVLLPLGVMIALLIARTLILRRKGARSWRAAALLGSAGAIALLVGLGLTQAQISSDRQRAVANDLLFAYAETEAIGHFGARLFTRAEPADPASLMRITERTARVRATIASLDAMENGVDRDRLLATHDRWVVAARHALALILSDQREQAALVDANLLTPTGDRLALELQAAADQYRAGAAAEAKRGRIASVLVLVGSIVALCLLLVRFGGARRAASAAIARNQAIQESELRFRALIDGSPDVITVIDADTTILAHADTVERVLGYPDGTMHGRRLAELLAPAEAEGLGRALRALAKRPGATETLNGRLRVADGRLIDIEASITNHVDNPHLGGFVVNGRDVSDRRLLEAQLEHQALHDPLTSLPNRALLEERMRGEFRAGLQPLHTLVLLDINEFKAINDTFGHAAGDTLLCKVAAQLRGAIGANDLLARVGGDEFAVLLDGIEDPDVAVELAEGLVEALRGPMDLGDGQLLPVRVAVGVAVSDGDGGAGDGDAMLRAEHLLRNAELAMYEAKRQPDGRAVELFVDEMHAAVAKRLELRTELERAIKEDQLVLHYQPIIDLQAMRIGGYEALVRWIHPERGMVSPGDFIPIAEESGLIVDLGSWVLREACRQVAEWRRDWPVDRYVSVNVAGQQLQRERFPEEVAGVLRDTGLPAHLLLLEVTETGLIGDSEGNERRLDELRELGTRLAIDDFGTGYSSLSYLHRFPFDVLKIDKSFVDRVATEEAGRTLVEAMVRMASSLNLTVVAEGIEDPEQVQALLRMDCALGQGFYFSRPLKAADVPAFSLPGDAERRRLTV